MGTSTDDTEEPLVMRTVQPDGTATMTVSVDDEDHKFDVLADSSEVSIEYQETLSWRGQIRVSEPRDEVYDILVNSDEFQEFVDGFGK